MKTDETKSQGPQPFAGASGSDTPATDAMQAKFRPDQSQAYEAWEHARSLERAGNSLSSALEGMVSGFPVPEDPAQLARFQRHFVPALRAICVWAKACKNPQAQRPDVSKQ